MSLGVASLVSVSSMPATLAQKQTSLVAKRKQGLVLRKDVKKL